MERRSTRIALVTWTGLVILFLWLPLALIMVYAFNKSNVQSWPISGFTTKWFRVAWHTQAHKFHRRLRKAGAIKTERRLAAPQIGHAHKAAHQFQRPRDAIGVWVWTLAHWQQIVFSDPQRRVALPIDSCHSGSSLGHFHRHAERQSAHKKLV